MKMKLAIEHQDGTTEEFDTIDAMVVALCHALGPLPWDGTPGEVKVSWRQDD